MKKVARIKMFALVLSLGVMAVPLCAQESDKSTEANPEEATIEVSPRFDYVTVEGDEKKFREDWWRDTGPTGGIESFKLRDQISPDTSFEAQGRVIVPEANYKARIRIDKKNYGYFDVDYTEFRRYYDDAGGYFPLFSEPDFRLDKDLYLDNGRLSVEGGLNLPHWPKLVLGYEHSFKDGEKSLLEWGDVTQGSFTRKINPSYEEIDERLDAVRAEIEQDIGKFHLTDKFRYEHYSIDTARHDRSLNLDTGSSQTVGIFQNYSHDAFFNTLFSDSWLHDKVYLSAGYLFTKIDGDASFKMSTVPFGVQLYDKDWYSNFIDVSQRAHIGNFNALIGPFKGFTIYGGLEGESTDKDGDTDAVYTENLPVVGIVSPTGITVTDRNKWGLQETLGVRYRGLPHTTLYAEGKWSQQNFDLFEREIQDGSVAINLDQNAWVNWQRYTFGFNARPFSRTTLSARYRYGYRDIDYDNDNDNTPNAYPGFITDQNFRTQDVTTRLTVRLMPRVQASLEYQYASMDVNTRFETTPPASVDSGTYTANVYGASLTVTPIARLYITQTVSYRDARIDTYHQVPSVESYDADVFQTLTDVGFAIDSKTNLKAQYLFSFTDNFKNFYTEGMPYGLDNHRHALLAGLERRFSEHLSARLRYGFYKYDEDSNGGITDYSAHLFGIGCTLRF